MQLGDQDAHQTDHPAVAGFSLKLASVSRDTATMLGNALRPHLAGWTKGGRTKAGLMLDRAQLALDAVDAALLDDPRAHVLVVVDEPLWQVGRALMQGAGSDLAVRDWIDAAGRVLALARRHPDALSLTGLQAACAAPDQVIRLLKVKLELAEPPGATQKIRASQPEAVPPAFLLAAELALSTSEPARQLRAGVQTLCLPMDAADPTPDALLQLYRDDIMQQKAQIAALAEARDAAETESDRHFSEVERLSQAMAALEGEIQALRNSTSWRVTGPLRGIRRLVGPR